MKGFGPIIWRPHLFWGEPSEIQHPLVNVERPSFRVQDGDRVRYSIDNLPELGFGRLDFFKCHCQCRLRSISLDGDSSNAARVLDQLNLVRSRVADFPVIHAESTEHPAIVRHDGSRPGGT